VTTGVELEVALEEGSGLLERGDYLAIDGDIDTSTSGASACRT
jgi:hypothetical protein